MGLSSPSQAEGLRVSSWRRAHHKLLLVLLLNEFDLGSTIALLLQDHRTVLPWSANRLFYNILCLALPLDTVIDWRGTELHDHSVVGVHQLQSYFNIIITLIIKLIIILTNWQLYAQGKLDIDTSVPSVTARTTRPLSTTAVKPRTEASRSSNSNSFCQPCFLCRCIDRVELTAGQCRQLGHLSNFLKATENSPFSVRHVKRSCHRAPLHFLLWRYTSFIIHSVL